MLDNYQHDPHLVSSQKQKTHSDPGQVTDSQGPQDLFSRGKKKKSKIQISERGGTKQTCSRCDSYCMRLAVAEVSHSANGVNVRGEQISVAWQAVVSYRAFSMSP